MLSSCLEKRLIVNIGKGGVGKSMLTAALARYAASQGKRVLICEVNAKDRMAALFAKEIPSSIDTLDQVWQLEDNIWTVNIHPNESMKEYVVQVLRLKILYKVVFENQLMQQFLRAVPGLQELVYIGKVWFHTTELRKDNTPRFDMVIVDSPATGHGLAMLRIPDVIVRTVPVGPMHTAAQKIKDVLEDPTQTQLNLVTLPEEMPINETVELYHSLANDLNMYAEQIFINQWPHSPFQNSHREQFSTLYDRAIEHPTLAPWFAVAKDAQKKHEKASRYCEKIKADLGLSLLTLPHVYAPPSEGDIVSSLSQELLARHTAQ